MQDYYSQITFYLVTGLIALNITMSYELSKIKEILKKQKTDMN
jgi:hypothetical protein